MEPNTPATVSLGSGIAVIILQIVMFCVGFIPILNFANLLIFPIILILDVVAIVTGILGMKKAALLDGRGKGAAIGGLVIGIGYILLIAVLFIIGLLIGGFAMIAGALG